MSEQEKRAFFVSGKLLSISEAAELTPYSAGYLSLRARKGKLKAIKIGRNWVTTKAVVLSYVREQQQRHKLIMEKLQQAEKSAV